MKVLFIQSIASAVYSYRPKEIADVPMKLAEAWIASGICTKVVEPKKPVAPEKEEKK